MTQRARLVLRDTDLGPQALLYPLDAGAFTGPIATCLLEPYQPLPRQQPGEIAEIHGAYGDARIVAADGTELHPRGSIQHHTPPAAAPIFAERGGVIVHPEIQQTRGNWRFVHSASFDDRPSSACRTTWSRPGPSWERSLATHTTRH